MLLRLSLVLKRPRRDWPDVQTLRPGLGRVTAWRGGQISFRHPPSEDELDALPTLSDIRLLVAEAIDATHNFAARTWDTAIRFLRSVDVRITRHDGQAPGPSSITPSARRAANGRVRFRARIATLDLFSGDCRSITRTNVLG
jgi:hypothetical protein